jgi:antitoxin component YwqK of YwqJK toxin-antitoxin module
MKRLTVSVFLILNLISYSEEVKTKIQEQNNQKLFTETSIVDSEIIDFDEEYPIYDENGVLVDKLKIESKLPYRKKVSYYENGQIKTKVSFKDGVKHGESITYYMNGQIKIKENYLNGKLNGERISYHENGQVENEEIYKDGVLQR